MKRNGFIISSILLCGLLLISSSGAYAKNEIEKKLKKIADNQMSARIVGLDKATLKAIRSYIFKNKDIPTQDFKKMRFLKEATMITNAEFYDIYGSNFYDFQGHINDAEQLEFFQIARKTWIRSNYKDYYLCTGDEEEAFRQADETARYRKENRDKLWKGRFSDEVIKINEGFLKKCRYDRISINLLLDAYHRNNKKKKYS